MPGINYAFREDWTGSGFFGFSSTGVQYADKGIRGLRHSIYFDQGPWHKVDTLGTSLYGQTYDAVTSRVPDRLIAISVAGTGSYQLTRRMRLPRDFGRWSVLSLFVKKTGTTALINSLTISLLSGGVADPAVNGSSINPVMADDWEQITLAPSSVYSPGDFITFVVQLDVAGVVDPGGPQIQIADFAATYVTEKGNI